MFISTQQKTAKDNLQHLETTKHTEESGKQTEKQKTKIESIMLIVHKKKVTCA